MADITKHLLVPAHKKVSEAEREHLLKTFTIKTRQLPKILRSDPGIAKLDVKAGDIIKIERDSRTAGVTVYYRVVVDN